MNREFFWTIFKRSAAKEDIFTECLAESLRQDKKLTERFLGVLLKGNRLGLSVTPIVGSKPRFLIQAPSPTLSWWRKTGTES